MNAIDVEIAVARYLNPRANLIIPNASWGMGFNYELDLLVITKAGYGWEIEIKVNKYDLINDTKKWKWKNYENNRIKRLYFAIPQSLEPYIEHIPEKAGVLIVSEKGRVSKRREAINYKTDRKFSEAERIHGMHLCCMRLWDLKETINRNKKERFTRI